MDFALELLALTGRSDTMSYLITWIGLPDTRMDLSYLITGIGYQTGYQDQYKRIPTDSQSKLKKTLDTAIQYYKPTKIQ